MFSHNGTKSIGLFLFSVLALLLLTLFEATLAGLTTTTERLISALLLTLPGLIGIVFGMLGILKNESRKWLAIIGVILNGLFALFMTFVLSFAG